MVLVTSRFFVNIRTERLEDFRHSTRKNTLPVTGHMAVSTLISAQWLRQLMLQSPKYLRIVDASWHLPKENRDPRKEFLTHRIPGAKFFDLDECIDKTSHYEHMLPNAEDFSNYVQSLGIDNDSYVIVYDNNEKSGLFSSPRLWWMMRAFGHERVSILDGGFPKWHAEGYPIETGPDNKSKVEGIFSACILTRIVGE